MPVDDSGTISTWAFSRSSGWGVSCPVTAGPLATFSCSQDSLGFQESWESSQSLTAGVPQDFIAGIPQTSTATVSRANGIQARATPRAVWPSGLGSAGFAREASSVGIIRLEPPGLAEGATGGSRPLRRRGSIPTR